MVQYLPFVFKDVDVVLLVRPRNELNAGQLVVLFHSLEDQGLQVNWEENDMCFNIKLFISNLKNDCVCMIWARIIL